MTESSTAAIAATTALATVAILAFLRFTLRAPRPKIYRSPLRTVIPTLSKDELDKLEYSPDEFPGARDVDTPYGSIRVYEWGPETGPKVLLIHGISTTCQTLGGVAHALVRLRRCRVLLFDLFGRGFSDSPGDLPHDARLYVSQALLALASSPLAWTGPGARVRVVGYSMGAAVAVHLVAAGGLPAAAVESVVLLAPAGLVRPEKFGRVASFVFTSGVVPERILAAVTRRRLRKPIAAGVKRRSKDAPSGTETPADGDGSSSSRDATPMTMTTPPQDPVGAAMTETVVADGEVSTRLEERVLAYVQWMVTHHAGFVPAFMSCIRHAPLTGQHDAYARLAGRGFCVAFVLGRDDEVVGPEDFAQDVMPLVGGEEGVFWQRRVLWKVVGGGHDFPMTHEGETVDAIEEFWGGVAGGW
ncbi:Alpha/Beta hydrolase protein [Phialemonium atrogriseum]|uniref:Alpha/Beta hydrolase protein n=1 Tax=Phialemonium atrogriseum TaxID=1093897 RepID=A0AAJ0C703_9PEZI|nr:Alpha/Beta hydrolase protein [Phialemonium atrogriseum]KAK1769834.1 Alpha/Beta hydrolase protein [Phialemonium atrogriseum]